MKKDVEEEMVEGVVEEVVVIQKDVKKEVVVVEEGASMPRPC